MPAPMTIGQYLIKRFQEEGVGHVFGIPGDYVLGFYDLLQNSPLKVINTCDEQGAGFAADAYARLRGLGVVCITYCVGGLKVANTTAEAFAEKSPVVVISGAPGVKEREKNPLLHHRVREFDTQKRVFEQLTIASAVLDDPQTAFREIDRVLRAVLRYKRPGYIELPRDMVGVAGAPFKNIEPAPTSDRRSLAEALAEATAMINAAKRPVILADVEVHRFNLQDKLVALAEKTNIPVAATILGKSVMGENHQQFIGIYEGAMGREETRRYVEESDCVIMLGVFMTDVNLGIYTARLDPARSISATSERLSIRYHLFENVRFEDFLRGLIRAPLRKRKLLRELHPPEPALIRAPRPNRKLTVTRLFQILNTFLNDNTIVIADVGDSLFGAADLYIHKRTEFLGTAYYASMGFAIPAAVGAQCAKPKLRPLVLVGDGAFMMTGMELATITRYNLNPIIVVLNNRGYGTERHMQDGPYNDLPEVRFARLPEVLGTGLGLVAETEAELETCLVQAEANRKSLSLVEVLLDPLDRSPALTRLTERLAQNL